MRGVQSQERGRCPAGNMPRMLVESVRRGRRDRDRCPPAGRLWNSGAPLPRRFHITVARSVRLQADRDRFLPSRRSLQHREKRFRAADNLVGFEGRSRQRCRLFTQPEAAISCFPETFRQQAGRHGRCSIQGMPRKWRSHSLVVLRAIGVSERARRFRGATWRDANAKPAGCLGRSHSSDLRGAGAVRDAMRIGTPDRLRHGRRHGAMMGRPPR